MVLVGFRQADVPVMSGRRRPRVVIAGAGHASLVALLDLAERPAEADITLVSRLDHAHYSGMVPGWIEGIYREGDMSVPLEPFARRVGVDFAVGNIVGADAGSLTLSDGRTQNFDLLVVNTGSDTVMPRPLSEGGAVPAKPFEKLIPGVAPHLTAGRSFVVVGAGVAGVEIALSLRARRPDAAIAIVEKGDTLLSGHPRAFVRRNLLHIERAGIDLRLARSVEALEDGEARLDDGAILPAACTITLTGPRPPSWLEHTPFPRARDGFLAVDERMRVRDHPHILAVGDVATREDDPRPKAGVFSVRSGPPLAEAVRALVAGVEPPPLKLQRRGLILLSTGGRNAIGVRNGIVVEGRWVWRLKDRFDRSFMARLSTG